MSRLTGTENLKDIPPKVLKLYEAVKQLVGEGADINEVSVSVITERAGIGKGTAYDYFDTKEDMIACAFIFYMIRLSEEFSRVLAEMGSLREQIDFLFDSLDHESEKKYCFVRFVHMMTDSSKFSRLLRDKLKGSRDGWKFPEHFFKEIIGQGRERGEIRDDVPEEYLIYAIFCRVLTYMMYICARDRFTIDAGRMRTLVVEGILEELGGTQKCC